jgi:hypothetical protein
VLNAAGTPTIALVAATASFVGQGTANAGAVYQVGNSSVSAGNVLSSGGAERLDALNGAFGSLTYGYVFHSRVLWLFDRFEAYGTLTNNQSAQGLGTSFATASSDGVGVVEVYDSAGIEGGNIVTLDTQEIGLRLKSDNGTGGTVPLIFSFEPFVRHVSYRASTDAAGTYNLSSKLESYMFGAQVALETEVQTGIAALTWVGRLAGGLYGMSADARMRESVGPYVLGSADEAFKIGYRLGLQSGFRLRLNEDASATVTGAVEHLSQSASYAYAPGTPGNVRSLETGGVTDYQAKLGLVFRMN